ncbi:MAG: FKBP-type peptidyl-prolyl cis-trans isomerase [Flavobacteriaceae bacterium]|jgi:FKBP-type peptidyl-prolyl cis-trans isomerase|nr:FKBP-type peptidyl-prolyl cis-trans isomerase [Flavobacteriaceae bacterium]
MIKKTILLVASGLLLTACNKDQAVSKLKTDDEKAAYAIGLNIAQGFKQQGLDKDLNIDIVKQGILDKLQNKELLFPEDSIQSFMMVYMPKLEQKVAERNAEASKKFLDKNKSTSGVKTTASGLQYKVEKEGEGAKPSDSDIVSVNFVLKTIDGEVVQDSKKTNASKPVDIPLNQVVAGWREGVELMSKGAKYTLYVPANLAWGQKGPAGPNQAMIFDVELVDFKPAALEGSPAPQQQLSAEQIEQIKKQMEAAQKTETTK